MCFLHAKRYAHLDIKTDNLLVGSKGARLCDFGTCVRVAPGQRVAGNFGTEGFKAPEVGSGEGFDAFLADVQAAWQATWQRAYALRDGAPTKKTK